MQIGKQFVVSTHVDHQLNNKRTELFYELLASPADKDVLHTYNLQLLVNDFPQSGILHALLLQVSNGENLKQAAAYYDPKILYKLTKDADALHVVSESQLVQVKQKASSAFFHVEETQPADAIEPAADEVLLAPWEEQDSPETITENTHAPHEVDVAAEDGPVTEPLPGLITDPAFEAEEHPSATELHLDPDAPIVESIPHPAHEVSAEPEHEIDEPVYDEITSHVGTQAAAPELETPEEESIIEQVIPFEHKEPEVIQPIEDDIFDEIISIDDINLAVQEYYATHTPEEVVEPGTAYHDVYSQALSAEVPVTEPQAGIAATEAPVKLAEAPVEPVAEVPKEETVFADRKVDLNDEAEKLILNNIAATDFFVFDKAFGDKKRGEDIKEEEPQPASVETAAVEPAPAEAEPIMEAAAPVEPEPFVESAPIVEAKAAELATAPQYTLPAKPYVTSKYNDEKMPYSFMWWLDKTRKEHSGIYQPFVEFKLDTTESIKPAEETMPAVTDELQQQYYENIFHLNTVEELERGDDEVPVVEFDSKKKEDAIIERFIQEVPQIRPQSGDKLDNENKAKKSSEDPEDLVTETLAQIYTDQMLYPKAIATYKKLMLKFPEKSSYFASQIQQLGKK